MPDLFNGMVHHIERKLEKATFRRTRSTVYLADPEKYNLLDFYIIEGRSNVGDSTEINKRLMGTMQLGMNGKGN